MSKLVIIAGVAIVTASGAAMAQPDFQGSRERSGDVTRQQIIERTVQRFDRMDINDDGRVTREEAQQARAQRREQRADRAFERLDIDRNGSVGRAEFERARAGRFERRAERRATQGETEHGRFPRRGRGISGVHADRLFGEQGFFTIEQFQARALARFDRLDSDRNGVLTLPERREARRQRRENHD